MNPTNISTTVLGLGRRGDTVEKAQIYVGLPASAHGHCHFLDCKVILTLNKTFTMNFTPTYLFTRSFGVKIPTRYYPYCNNHIKIIPENPVNKSGKNCFGSWRVLGGVCEWRRVEGPVIADFILFPSFLFSISILTSHPHKRVQL